MDMELYLEFLERSHKQQKVLVEMLKTQLQKEQELREKTEEELRLVIRNSKKKVKR